MEKSEIAHKIEELKVKKHCKNCGMIDPVMIETFEMEEDKYTECCQEITCESQSFYDFGNDEVSVSACCWAMAELEFQALGIDPSDQKTMRILNDLSDEQ